MATRKAKKRSDFDSKSEFNAWKKRSDAAKRGWQTRYKRELPKKIRREKKVIANARDLLSRANKKKKKVPAKRKIPAKPVKKPKKKIPVKPGKKPKKRKHRITVTELQKEIAELRAEREWLQMQVEISTWPPDAPLHRLRMDGTVGVEVSRLRQHEEAIGIWQYLEKARLRGPIHLQIAANKVALLYECPIREVYTLLYSP